MAVGGTASHDRSHPDSWLAAEDDGTTDTGFWDDRGRGKDVQWDYRLASLSQDASAAWRKGSQI